VSTGRPSDDASTEEWQLYVLHRVAPLIAERDVEFQGALPLFTALAAQMDVETARFAPVVREMLALAQAAAVSVEGLLDTLKAAFAPDPMPWPLWLGRPRQAEGGDGSEAYFAPPAWEAHCERVYLREWERRRLEAQGLDFATIERAKNRGTADERAIMAQAGLGSLGGGVVVVVERAPQGEGATDDPAERTGP